MSTADRIINHASTAAEAYAKRVGLTEAAPRLQYQIGLLNREIVVLCEELAWAKRELRMASELVAPDDAPPNTGDFESLCRATAQAARVAA